MRLCLSSICIAILIGAAMPALPLESGKHLTLTKTIPLPGVKGRFDHFAIDTNAHRLFVAALGNDTLEMLDVAAGKRLHTIGGLHKPTGVVFLPAENEFGVANGNDGTFRVYDGKTYKETARVDGLDDADNVRRDARTGLIYVGYSDGALAVIDPQSWKITSKVKLPAHPESFQLEPAGKRIFVNLPDAKKVGVVDREARKLIAEWPMEKFRANFPMAVDELNRRVFIGCRQPARLAVLDAANGRIVSDLGISGDTDDLFYDARLKRIYVSCGEGFIDVLEQQSPDAYTRVERIPTSKGARTCFFSAELREFYLAVPEQGVKSAELRIYKTAD
jgi:DNA-binding beta-propeller fold protein YncE